MTPEQMADVVMSAVRVATAPLLDRIAALEAKSLIPGPQSEPGPKGERGEKGDRGESGERGADGPIGPVGAKGEKGDPGLAGKDGADGLNGKDGRDGVGIVSAVVNRAGCLIVTTTDGLEKDLGLIVGKDGQHGESGEAGRNGADGRDGAQGPAGAQGPQGAPGEIGPIGPAGLNGKDGADGLGWDDLVVEQIDERTAVVKCQRGLQVKEVGRMTFPVEIYRGVYLDGKTYERGDGVTWAGSEWHCNEATSTRPGDGSKAWTLKVKRGRDGKDGKDASSLPVVSIKR